MMATSAPPIPASMVGQARCARVARCRHGDDRRNLGRGNRPAWHCFGQLHATPISERMLVRNVALAVPAILLVLTA